MDKKINKEKLKVLQKVFMETYNSNPILSTFISSIIATIGLYIDSKLLLIGSMLLSPILKIIINYVIHNILIKNKVKLNIKYNTNIFVQIIIVSIIAISISFVLGVIMKNIDFYILHKTRNFPTDSMKNRSKPKNVLYNILLTILCTILIPISIVNNNLIYMVGISIVIALIPLLSNIGLSISIDDTKNSSLKKYKLNSILYGISMYIINLIIIIVPSKFLLNSFIHEKNIYKIVELIN